MAIQYCIPPYCGTRYFVSNGFADTTMAKLLLLTSWARKVAGLDEEWMDGWPKTNFEMAQHIKYIVPFMVHPALLAGSGR